MIPGQQQSQSHRYAECKDEGKVRGAIQLEEQRRQNPEQSESPEDKADDGFEDYEEREHWQTDRLPK